LERKRVLDKGAKVRCQPYKRTKEGASLRKRIMKICKKGRKSHHSSGKENIKNEPIVNKTTAKSGKVSKELFQGGDLASGGATTHAGLILQGGKDLKKEQKKQAAH